MRGRGTSAERQGLRQLTRTTCDAFDRIPMQGVVETLSVSVVAGACLLEVVRQRLSATSR